MLLTMASCATEDMLEPFYPAGNEGFSLQIVTTDRPQTRTDGDDGLHENDFVSLDYYFFKTSTGNNDPIDSHELLLHKQEGVRPGTKLDASVHNYTGVLTPEDVQALFGYSNATEGNIYVYVLTNLLPATRSTINAQNRITLGALKKIMFKDPDISKNAAQDCFVMYGGGVVSLTTDAVGVKTISGPAIKVTRDAAKVVLTITEVKDTVHVADAEADNGYQIWQSDKEHMYVMFYKGVNKSFTHSQINEGAHYVPNSGEDDCYFNLDKKVDDQPDSWRQMNKKTNPTTSAVTYTHDIPYYTYLSDWREESGLEDQASYMILMVPWKRVDADGNALGDRENTYYQIHTSTTDTYYENYFYHINIKVGVLGSFKLPEPVEITSKYMIVPWGEQPVESTLREGRYLIVESHNYVMNNVSTGSVPYITSHPLRYAYVSNVVFKSLKTFESTSPTNTTYSASLGGTKTVNTYVRNESFNVSYNDGKISLTHNISPEQYTRYDVTVTIVNQADLREEIVFTIYPAIYVDKENGGNAFVNGYFGNVTPLPPHRNNGTWQQNNDGSYRVRNTRGGTQEAGDGSNPYHVWAGGAYNYNGNNPATNTYGSLITGNPGLNNFLTRITVTSFTEEDEKFDVLLITRENNNNPAQTQLMEYTYKLSDPRVSPGWTSNDLLPYVVTASSQYNAAYSTQNWDNAGSILVGTKERDKIAPEFLVTSAWGRCNPNSINFEQAQKRCATYQEAGYPAGRWRLPTVAEISYIYTLQEKGIINNLFNPGHSGGYWSSEGYAVRGYNGEPALRTTYTGTDPVRCVYDVWYWGDTPESTNEFHAMPTNN